MSEYAIHQPTREELSKLAGATLLEFGTDWCGYCNRARPLITQALSQFSYVKHLKIEDGPGRKLGRLFKVKLWPTLILLQDGMEIGRFVRPESADEIIDFLSSSKSNISQH